MPTPPKKSKTRTVTIGCLAAKLLGRARVADAALTEHALSLSFPAFNAQEITSALAELVDKQLLTQKKNDNYVLTEIGRDAPVSIA